MSCTFLTPEYYGVGEWIIQSEFLRIGGNAQLEHTFSYSGKRNCNNTLVLSELKGFSITKKKTNNILDQNATQN